MGIVMAFVGGCNSNSDSSSSTGSTSTASADKKTDSGGSVEVAFETNNISDYWNLAKAGTEKAQKDTPGITVDFKEPADGQVDDQTKDVNDLVSRGVKAIAISPVKPDDETPLINDLVKKGIVVITQDSDAPNSDRTCYIGTNNVDAGKLAGEAIKKAIPGGGNIMVFVGKKDAQNAKERLEGVQDALKGSNVKIVDVRTDDADHTRAKQNVSDTLVGHPEVNCLVGLWSYNGPMILSAVKDAKREGKIKIVCFDGDPDTIQGLKDGFIDATVVQQPYMFGQKAVQLMAQILKGDKSGIPASKQIFFPAQTITPATIAKYEADQKALMAGG